MGDRFISIIFGLSGALIGVEIWEISLKIAGSCLFAFAAGFLGLAGKRFYEKCFPSKKNRHEKNN